MGMGRDVSGDGEYAPIPDPSCCHPCSLIMIDPLVYLPGLVLNGEVERFEELHPFSMA